MLSQNIIAMAFDFDDTLTNEAVSHFLRSKGVDTVKFWDTVKERVGRGWDVSLAYVSLFTDMLKPGNQLAGVTREHLSQFGQQLAFYPGVTNMFRELRVLVETLAKSKGIPFAIEFYVISGGLLPIIDGVPFRAEL